MFYLPLLLKRKNKVTSHRVHFNFSETATESSKSSKSIITESEKKKDMKYILYWNEAYDSKGELTYIIKHILAYLI